MTLTGKFVLLLLWNTHAVQIEMPSFDMCLQGIASVSRAYGAGEWPAPTVPPGTQKPIIDCVQVSGTLARDQK